MSDDFYVVVITALLPLTAVMLVTQANPYHALIIRGILGAVAALVYALFGAADVALTEALVGTMLSITLYAVAVRSSLSLRLGVIAGELDIVPAKDKVILNLDAPEIDRDAPLQETGVTNPQLQQSSLPKKLSSSEQLLSSLRAILKHHHMRLELIPYSDRQTLHNALMEKEIHAACVKAEPGLNLESTTTVPTSGSHAPYHLQTRVQRLYNLVQAELPPALAHLAYIKVTSRDPKKLIPSKLEMVEPLEGQR